MSLILCSASASKRLINIFATKKTLSRSGNSKPQSGLAQMSTRGEKLVEKSSSKMQCALRNSRMECRKPHYCGRAVEEAHWRPHPQRAANQTQDGWVDHWTAHQAAHLRQVLQANDESQDAVLMPSVYTRCDSRGRQRHATTGRAGQQ